MYISITGVLLLAGRFISTRCLTVWRVGARVRPSWFFGFKLHLLFNDRGELLNMALTFGNVDDRQPVPILMRKCAIAETIIDQLKNISQIERTRHRSMTNFLVNLLCGLIAYYRLTANLLESGSVCQTTGI
jgi:hypothetical protein